MTRLAIIDIAGQQPKSAHDGDLQVVFNGEIYNYRASDLNP
jgi:asparagine synthase (glutamine-hydrolysing)